ncbi:DUF2256 domain-containing protein [Alcanivorax sp. S6407]|uniref:DUF2256 domain-containing protein n=1 Tax=Alcanivorax sp. S6407 TaxID=2926424 RepID=UPI001FF44146|nr:DUF2256 domain-containing protein [Alcanivorax sp. S6407]MCK0154036.1 DUF2256 domain-containing protein [Alcanivorax sp. S6407]
MKPTWKGNKSSLPEKTCPVCGRAFSWRKKWARDWDAVIYCSERCRREKRSP